MGYVLLTVWEFAGFIAGVTLFSLLFGLWAGRALGKFNAIIERIKEENEKEKRKL